METSSTAHDVSPPIAEPPRPVISEHVLPLFHIDQHFSQSSSSFSRTIGPIPSSSMLPRQAPLPGFNPMIPTNIHSPYYVPIPRPIPVPFESDCSSDYDSDYPSDYSSDYVSDSSPVPSSDYVSAPPVASVLCPASHPISSIDHSSAQYPESDEDDSDLDSTRANPPSTLESFFASLSSTTSRRAIESEFSNIRDSLPPSPTNPYTPIQMAAVWLSEQFTQNPFVEAFVYKKVANKTRPVVTTLPENFRIT